MTTRPSLIFLPGLACNASMWEPLLQTVAGADLAALQPAISDVHTRFSTFGQMAAALLEEHPGELVLCGASMGGMLAMEVGRQAPQRVKGLALLGTSAQPESDEMRQLREGAIGFFEQGRVQEVLQFNLPLAFHPSRAKDSVLHQTYLDMVLAAGAQQLIAQNRAVIARPDARLHLPQLRCPVLVMCGDADALTPPERSREIAAVAGQANLTGLSNPPNPTHQVSLVMVAQCGHMLTLERPQEVSHVVMQWLNDYIFI